MFLYVYEHVLINYRLIFIYKEKKMESDQNVDKCMNNLETLRAQIEEKEKNIANYEKEIKDLKDLNIRRKKDLDRFQKRMDVKSQNIDENSSFMEKSVIIENSICNSNFVNENLIQEANERNLSNIQEQTNVMKKDVNELLSRIENTSKELNDVLDKEKHFNTIIEDEEKSKQLLEEAHNLNASLMEDEKETNKILIEIYDQIIDILKKRINRETDVHSAVVQKYKEEISNFKPNQTEIDDFEIKLIQQLISSKKAKLEKIESVEKEYESKINNMNDQLKEKFKKVKHEQKNVKKSQQRCDTVSDCVICPNYYVKIAQMVCETQESIKKYKSKIESRETQNKIIRDELMEKKKLLRLFAKALGKEEEKRLSYMSDINRLDTEMIQINARENFDEMFYDKNVKELDKLLKRKYFLEEEFDSMLHPNFKLNDQENATKKQLNTEKENKSNEKLNETNLKRNENDKNSQNIQIVEKKKEFLPYNYDILVKLKKDKKKLKKELIELIMKIKVQIDDNNNYNAEIKKYQIELLRKPKQNGKPISTANRILQLYDTPTSEEMINLKKRNLEKRKKRIQEKEDRLRRVEFVNGIFDHKTPFIFTDVERVCDRTKLRKDRINECLEKERIYRQNVSKLEEFSNAILNEIDLYNLTFNCNEFDEKGENWFHKLSQYLPLI